MKPTHVVLHEYAGDAWRGRIVDGDAVGEVERWLAALEARPREAPASGKPLAWLYLGTLSDDRLRATRSVGVQTDVRRALDRGLLPGELEELIAIFDRHGQPFGGEIDRA